jgi:hypothetical protein
MEMLRKKILLQELTLHTNPTFKVLHKMLLALLSYSFIAPVNIA